MNAANAKLKEASIISYKINRTTILIAGHFTHERLRIYRLKTNRRDRRKRLPKMQLRRPEQTSREELLFTLIILGPLDLPKTWFEIAGPRRASRPTGNSRGRCATTLCSSVSLTNRIN